MQESTRHKELAKHRTAAVMKREQDKAAKGNTLDKMTEKFKEGPLLLLRRYYKTSVRLQVVTRHASGVRGTAVGKACILYANDQTRKNGIVHQNEHVIEDSWEMELTWLAHPFCRTDKPCNRCR